MKVQHRYFGYNRATLSEHVEGKHDYPDHLHHFLEVICVLEGEIEITVGGVPQLAKKGDIAVIFPFQVHSQHTLEYCKIWVGMVSPAYVTDILSWENFYVPQMNVFTPRPTTFAYIEDVMPKQSYWVKLPSSISHRRYRRTKAIYYVILEEFFRNIELNTSNLNTGVLSAAYMYINEHYTEDLSLKKVAAAIGYAPNYVSSCLSAIPDTNFRTILNSARVEHAKGLLISTDMRIADIALESGFSSENVFYSIFEKHTGQTPRQYRISKMDHP